MFTYIYVNILHVLKNVPCQASLGPISCQREHKLRFVGKNFGNNIEVA